MSLALATKGIISDYTTGIGTGSGPSETIILVVPVCPPDMETVDLTDLAVVSHDIGRVPMLASKVLEIAPIVPNTSVISSFPKPINI